MKGNRLWLLGTVAVMAVVVLVGWFLGISPRLAQVDAISLELAGVEQLNAVQEAEIAALQQQDADVSDLEDRLDDLRTAIPTSVGAENFVDEVAAVAARTGVTVTAIQFAKPGVWGVAPDTAETPASTAAPAETEVEPLEPPIPIAADGVFTVAVSIQVVGDPLAVIAFSRLLQEGDRLFLMAAFDYAVSPDKAASIGGYLFVYADPNVPLEEILGTPTAETPTPEETPTDATPTPSPTPTPTP